MSLLTCFHFGYHHEHHLQPDVPWWRLPDAHADYLASAAARGGA
ncbi:MAG: fatty acid desaturase [Filomicrobium sp.]